MPVAAFEPSPDVVFQELDGQTVLLDVRQGVYFALNLTGSRVWHLLLQHKQRDRILEQMTREFDAPAETVAADLDRLLGELASAGLIRAQSER